MPLKKKKTFQLPVNLIAKVHLNVSLNGGANLLMLIPYLLMHLNREIYCPLLFYYESAISFSLTYKLYNSFEKKVIMEKSFMPIFL